MGNELFSQYTIEKTPFLSAGYLNLWKIYRGTHKERKQDVCVFVFEKKMLERYSVNEKEEILSILRKEATSLIKYKHPSILGIVEPLIEDKTTLGFVTEEICFTLTSWIESINPSKLEIKQMIIELNKVVTFLHEDAHVIHANLNPDVIFIDKLSKIKISGMNFAINDPPVSGGDIALTLHTMPNLKYTAPEVVYSSKVYYSSDIFSVNLIIYTMLKYNKGATDRELLNLSMNTIDSYKSNYSTLDNKLTRANFDPEDMALLTKGLVKDHSYRPVIKELTEHAWFNDPKLKAFSFIQNLQGNDPNKNAEFLQSFPKIVSMFETKLIISRFLPCLLEGLKNEFLINPLLPAIFSIAELPGIKIDFSRDIWPRMKELFQLKSINASSLYYLLSKVIFIGDHLSNTEFTNSFLNIICKAMDCNVPKIQSMVATNLNYITKKIDSLSFKNQIYPRVIQIVSTTNSTVLKLELLTSIKNSLTQLDQTIINESLLNNLEKIRKADGNEEIMMSISSIYEEIAKFASIESIANKILPALISMLVSAKISRKSFDITFQLVYKYLEKIKSGREKDLIDDMKGEKKGNDILSMDSMTGPGIGTGNKDDFLSSFFGGDSSQKGTIQSTMPSMTNTTQGTFDMDFSSKKTEPISMPYTNPANNNSGGFDFTYGTKNITNPPTNSTNSLFDGFTTTPTYPTNTSKPSYMPSKNIKTTNSNSFLSGNTNQNTSSNSTMNWNTNQNQPNSSNDLFANLNTIPSKSAVDNNNSYGISMTSKPQTQYQPNKDVFNSLLNNLGSSTNNNMQSTPINLSNPSNDIGGFNQNNLDFLSSSTNPKPANNATFGFDFASPQPTSTYGNNNMNMGMNNMNLGMGNYSMNTTNTKPQNNDIFSQFNMTSQPNKPNQQNTFNF